MELQIARRRVRVESSAPGPAPKPKPHRKSKPRPKVKTLDLPNTTTKPRPRGRHARSSSSPDSDLLETPPPPTHIPIPAIVDKDGVALQQLPPPTVEEDVNRSFSFQLQDLYSYLPPAGPPKGPVCEEQTRTCFSFAGHLHNLSQWQPLHQALVTYMFEMNMSPQVAFHQHITGHFRGLDQQYTMLTIVTGSTWTDVFENDMQKLIRMVWQGSDRQIEISRHSSGWWAD